MSRFTKWFFIVLASIVLVFVALPASWYGYYYWKLDRDFKQLSESLHAADPARANQVELMSQLAEIDDSIRDWRSNFNSCPQMLPSYAGLWQYHGRRWSAERRGQTFDESITSAHQFAYWLERKHYRSSDSEAAKAEKPRKLYRTEGQVAADPSLLTRYSITNEKNTRQLVVITEPDAAKKFLQDHGEEINQQLAPWIARFKASDYWHSKLGEYELEFELVVACQLLSLTTSAQLLIGETDAAMDDLMLLIKMSQMPTTGDSIYSHHLQASIQEYVIDLVWQLLNNKTLDGSQLQALQRTFPKGNNAQEMAKYIVASGIWVSSKWQDFANDKMLHGELSASDRFMMPYRLSKQNKSLRELSKQLSQLASQGEELSYPASKKWILPDYSLELLYKVDVGSILRQQLTRNTLYQQMRTAIALERFYLDHGSYPSQMDQLVPTYLADAPINGLSGESISWQLDKNGPVMQHDRTTTTLGKNGECSEQIEPFVWRYWR